MTKSTELLQGMLALLKDYRVTTAGRRRLREEMAYWNRLSDAIGVVPKAVPEDV